MIDEDFPLLEFTANDRCDGCGAQALVLATHAEHTDLLFCRHHYKASRDHLMDEGWALIEDYEAMSQYEEPAVV